MSNIVKLEELPEGWLRSTDKPHRGIKSKLGSTSASVSLTFFKMRRAVRHLILRRTNPSISFISKFNLHNN